MKPEWKQYLENRGAEFDQDHLIHFGNEVRERRFVRNGNLITDLSEFGLISVRGEDAEQFLQGQLTNDIRLVDDCTAQYSAYCSPKGRILTCLMIFKRQDCYYLQLPRSLLEPTLTRLKMFVLIAKVTLEDASDSLIHIGCSGPDIEADLQSVAGTLPEKIWQCTHTDTITVIRIPGHLPRFEIICELGQAEKVWTTLDVHAAPAGPFAWEILDIDNGIATIYPETSDAFVPQMVNMQLIDAVSFKKGCYTGQEIVARMQYLGKLKRRLYKAHTVDGVVPAIGMDLYAAGSSSGQGAGKVVNVQSSPPDGYDMLVVAEISSQKEGALHLESENGPVLEFIQLPYPVD